MLHGIDDVGDDSDNNEEDDDDDRDGDVLLNHDSGLSGLCWEGFCVSGGVRVGTEEVGELKLRGCRLKGISGCAANTEFSGFQEVFNPDTAFGRLLRAVE